MTRPTDHSLPGIGWALMITTSSRSIESRFVVAGRHEAEGRHRFALGAGRDHADLPVGQLVDRRDVDERVVGTWRMRASSPAPRSCPWSARGSPLAARGHRRVDDLLDAVHVAGEAGHDDPLVGLGEEHPAQDDADGRLRRGVTRLLGVVESDSKRRMPCSSAMAPMRARSVRRPSTGWRSSLKSPECRITPWACGRRGRRRWAPSG